VVSNLFRTHDPPVPATFAIRVPSETGVIQPTFKAEMNIPIFLGSGFETHENQETNENTEGASRIHGAENNVFTGDA
jgi:hypothetical protein